MTATSARAILRWWNSFALVAVFVLLLIALAAISAYPQVFVNKQFVTGWGPTQIKAADLNRDARPDLVVQSGDNLLVHLGKGDGTFYGGIKITPPTNSTTEAPNISEFEMVDTNKDGRPDLIVAGGHKIAVHIGNGNGTFQAASSYDLPIYGGDYPNSLTTGDFNEDGNIDLAITSAYYIYVLYGNGDGTFQLPEMVIPNEPMPGTIWSLEAGDFDGDGHMDLAFASCCTEAEHYYQLHLIYGDGHGWFPDKRIHTIGYMRVEFRAADFDLDGRSDLLARYVGCATVPCYGVVLFWPQKDRSLKYTSSWSDARPAQPVSGDYSMNGYTELVTVGPENEYGNFGSDLFEMHKIYLPNLASWRVDRGAEGRYAPTDVTTADFDRDGRPDLAITYKAINQIAVRMNITPGCAAGALYTMSVCSPTATYRGTQVFVSARANSDTTIVANKIYVDGVARLTGIGQYIHAIVPISRGTHRVTVKAWDKTGRVIQRSTIVNIQ